MLGGRKGNHTQTQVKKGKTKEGNTTKKSCSITKNITLKKTLENPWKHGRNYFKTKLGITLPSMTATAVAIIVATGAGLYFSRSQVLRLVPSAQIYTKKHTEKHTPDWSNEDVLNWLGRRGLSEYKPIFKQNKITGRDLLDPDFNKKALMKYGIEDDDEQDKILLPLSQLVAAYATNVYALAEIQT